MPDITVRHNDRVRALDPLLAPLAPLDCSGPDYLRVEMGAGAAEAVFRHEVVDPASVDAIWGALRRHTADLRSAGPDADRVSAVEALLDDWLERIGAVETPGDTDSSARVLVASRDIAVVNALYARGFGPVGIRGVRLRPRDAASIAPQVPRTLQGGTVRLATVHDAVALGRLDARLLSLDAHFAGVTVRDDAAGMFAESYRGRLALAPDTTWVLERDGAITGMVHLMPDASTPEPDAPAFALSGGQYLVVMFLDESERGAGIGAEFAQLAHDILDAAGTPYISLSYAVANPRSGPFWSRMGYRPVVTEWQRRPAVFGRR